jgi:hypothetical protein
MYGYKNEDVAWQRLQDLQAEMENSRLMASGLQQLVQTTRLLAQRAWCIAGLAMQRPPRPSPAAAHMDGEQARAADTAA